MVEKYLQEYKFYLKDEKSFSIYEDYELQGSKTVESILSTISDDDILCKVDSMLGNVYVPFKNVICVQAGNVVRLAVHRKFDTELRVIKKRKTIVSK